MAQTLELTMTHGSMGTIISFLSAVLSTNKTIKLTTNRPLFVEFQKIFNIPTSRLKILLDESLPDTSTASDIVKFFSPYFVSDTVQVLGQKYPVYHNRNPDKKPMVAVACYSDYYHLHEYNFEDPDSKHFPHHRYYTLEQYTSIIELLKSIGFEVITVDSHQFTLEQKVYILNEMCSCMIGYEGGLHHLAHLLQLPSIVLPWPNGQHNRFLEHILHMDTRTYFPTSLDEVLSWNRSRFIDVIDSLCHRQGNNIFNNKEVAFLSDRFDMIAFDTGTHSTPQMAKCRLNLESWDVEFIKQNLDVSRLSILKTPCQVTDYRMFLGWPQT